MRSAWGSFIRVWIGVVCSLAGAGVASSGARAASCERGDLRANNLRLRALISEISADALARMDAGESASDVRPQLLAALELRNGLARAWTRTPLLPVDRAPYFGALLESQYQTLYDQALQEEISKITSLSYEQMFDELTTKVDAYHKMTPAEQGQYAAKGELEKQISVAAGQLKGCMLKRAMVKEKDLKLASEQRSCKLDLSEQVKKPGIVGLGLKFISCPRWSPFHWFTFQSDCGYRRAVYNLAKPDLIKLKQDAPGLVAKAFDEAFPKALIEGGKAAEIQASIPGLLNQKIAGGYAQPADASTLWRGSLLDANQESASQQVANVCLSEATLGQQSDLRLASALKRAQVAETAAAPLLYGAVNRLFLIAGGNEVTLDARARIPTQSESTPLPTNQFGGWGYGSRVENAAPAYLTWDLDPEVHGFYNPASLMPNKPETPLRLFPAELSVGVRGEPLSVLVDGQTRAQTERVSDLLALGLALVEHVDRTAPEAPLGAHFASAEILKTDLLKADRPAAFPEQARTAAVGLLVALFQNFIQSDLGHLELGSVNAVLYESIGLEGRLAGPLKAEAWAQVALWAASIQRSLDRGDAVYPRELNDRELRRKIDQLLGLASLTMAGLGVGSSGLIKPWIYELPGLPNVPTLRSQLSGLRAMGASLARNGSEPVRRSAARALMALERFWAEGKDVPYSSLPVEGAQPAPLTPEDAWYAVNAWNELRALGVAELLKTPNPETLAIDYERWDERFARLRARLLQQLGAS